MDKNKIINQIKSKLGQVKLAENLKFETKIEDTSDIKAHVFDLNKDEIIKGIHKKNKDLSLKDLSKNDLDFDISHFSIKWEFEIESRDWGIKNLSVHIPTQEIEIDIIGIEYYIDDHKTVEIPNISVKLKIESAHVSGLEEVNLSHDLYPKTLSFYKNKYTIEF
jgi:hypothetical protein